MGIQSGITSSCRAALILALASNLISPHALANEGLHIAGFITAGAQWHGDDQAVYYGVEDNLDFKSASVAGLQFNQTLNDQVNATIQLLARGSDDFDPEVEWAYLAYAFNSSLTLRLGRMATPFYMLSDYYNVGFAYTWATHPAEVYGTNRITRYDGLELLWRTRLGPVNMLVQPLFGFGETDVYGPTAEFNNTLGLSSTFDWNDFSLRLGVYQGDLMIEDEGVYSLIGRGDTAAGQSLVTALRSVGANDAADQILADDDKSLFFTVGVEWNPGDWQMRAEYAHRDIDNILMADVNGYYLFAGRSFGKFTPYAIFGKIVSEDEKTREDVPAALAQLDPITYQTLYGSLLAIESSAWRDQQSYGIGVRWDLADNFALKAEWKRIEALDNTMGFFEVAPDDDVIDLVTINLNAVF